MVELQNSELFLEIMVDGERVGLASKSKRAELAIERDSAEVPETFIGAILRAMDNRDGVRYHDRRIVFFDKVMRAKEIPGYGR